MTWSAKEGRCHQSYNENRLREIAGCVPVYDGTMIYMITSSRNPGDWILPKGGRETDESLERTAARETAEEAGLEGTLETLLHTSANDYTQSYFFELTVTKVLDEWPEGNFRQRKLMSVQEALEKCKRPDMIEAIRNLSSRKCIV
jgi:diphosphoinositol-polyphosphate diphosphatase